MTDKTAAQLEAQRIDRLEHDFIAYRDANGMIDYFHQNIPEYIELKRAVLAQKPEAAREYQPRHPGAIDEMDDEVIDRINAARLPKSPGVHLTADEAGKVRSAIGLHVSMALCGEKPSATSEALHQEALTILAKAGK